MDGAKKVSKIRNVVIMAIAVILLLLIWFIRTGSNGTNTYPENGIEPVAADYSVLEGEYSDLKDVYYVDIYETTSNIVLITDFYELWAPGTDLTDGTKINSGILDENIRKSYDIACARDAYTTEAAYNDDINEELYSVLDGLGRYRKPFIDKVEIDVKSIMNFDIDKGSIMYDTINLVKAVCHSGDNTTAKIHSAYPRPYRWNAATGELLSEGYVKEQVIEAVAERRNLDNRKLEEDTSGFPSGHTYSAFQCGIALAYALPEQYDEILMRAAELGNNRIVAGVHSALDVMGARLTATATSAAVLYNDKNEEIAYLAYQNTRDNLVGMTDIEIASADDYKVYQENLARYNYYMTYDFSKIGTENLEMRVPKGAESLLRTRFPYLDDTQIRWILYSTGLESGFPILDDDEGWGRLNLYKASNGYGAFYEDVVVNMDAGQGSFNAVDNWLNDISGEGKLVKEGTGTLVLAGNNTFTGGIEIWGGGI